MQLTHIPVNTPLGVFGMVHGADGVVIVSGFAGLDDLLAMLTPQQIGPVRSVVKHEYSDHVRAYFKGDYTALRRIATEQAGGPFYHAVWQALQDIPPGRPYTYTELAAAAGRPKAVRAAGTACARNKVSLLVPCHRVLPASGIAGNYIFGTDIKKNLLAHEGWHGPTSLGSR